MDYNNYIRLSSEIKLLEEMISEIPEDNVIEIMGLQSRLEDLLKIINGIEQPAKPIKAKLTFRGKPVIGSHGIAADFGAKVAGAFTDIVAAIAASLSDNLSYMGPIPDKSKNQLIITGTALGSFGFEFEPQYPEQQELFPPFTEIAIQKAQELLQVSVDGTDDDITEIVGDIHPRAVKKVAEFLELINQNESTCALDFKNKTFRFKELEQVKVSIQRLSEDNIKESDREFEGAFIGYLPISRNFEFINNVDNKTIRGKISVEIDKEKADYFNKNYLNKPIKATLHITQVGKGRPNYVLQSIEHIRL